MPAVSPMLLLTGLVFGVVLLAVGFWLGRRRSGSHGDLSDHSLVSDHERQRMVGLLEGLSRWTTEYSGNVSSYQLQIGEISAAVRQNMNAAGTVDVATDSSPGSSDARLVTLLGQMMSTNEALQSRLAAAESQLEEQTQQIESYLAEARTDGLTGLHNRRAFDKKLDELFEIYRKGGTTFVLVLIDIDHFKSINDTYGHPVGDVVLQQVATKLEADLSDALMVARFGGEEFAILTDAPIRLAAQQMNAFRKALAEQTITAGGDTLQVTISVGLSRPKDDLAIGPLVRRADEALYAAKKVGRNRVYFNDGAGAQLFGAPEVAKT
ncbi:MAG: GGDEF domain-containing protein [Planctomycetota bacterium]